MHRSVLLTEVIDGLNIQSGNIVVDATVNGGGVSTEIAKRFGDSIKLVCIDLDKGALAKARERVSNLTRNAIFISGNFGNLGELLRHEGIGSIDRIVFDLGLSSNQLENSGRGFSFQKEEPLIMTFTETPGEETLTARDIVNSWDQENIETIIKSYGEERYAKKIARAIVDGRKIKSIETTTDLRELIEKNIPRRGKIHPATRTFQALRIAVNDELGNLKRAIDQSFSLLSKNGRIAIISFHSLEDRIVKHSFREYAKKDSVSLITKKPTIPSDEEISQNPRSRSAKLRILEKKQ